MISRENYHLVYKHLDYRKNVMQNDEGTIATYWQSLKHLLQWADSRSFKDAHKIIPAFPEYLLTARNDGKEKALTPKYMKKGLSHARAFFDWLRLNERGYSSISEAWIGTLQVRKSAGTQSRLQERHYWHLEDAQKIAAMKTKSLRDKRDQAALCFIYLSGMRIGAFVTLPVECVDIARRRIEQLPEKGVHTKNSKAAITFLLNIPDLLEVAKNWDAFVRSKNLTMWYPPINRRDYQSFTSERFTGASRDEYKSRCYVFEKGLRRLCDKAGIDYKSAHKIRHGFGVYGVKNAKDMAQMKAISQNMMHANMGITDGLYGKLGEDDLAEILSNFGE